MTFAGFLVWAWAKVDVLAAEAVRAAMGSADAQLRLLVESEMGVNRQANARLDPEQQLRIRWRSAC